MGVSSGRYSMDRHGQSPSGRVPDLGNSASDGCKSKSCTDIFASVRPVRKSKMTAAGGARGSSISVAILKRDFTHGMCEECGLKLYPEAFKTVSRKFLST